VNFAEKYYVNVYKLFFHSCQLTLSKLH